MNLNQILNIQLTRTISLVEAVWLSFLLPAYILTLRNLFGSMGDYWRQRIAETNGSRLASALSTLSLYGALTTALTSLVGFGLLSATAAPSPEAARRGVVTGVVVLSIVLAALTWALVVVGSSAYERLVDGLEARTRARELARGRKDVRKT